MAKKQRQNKTQIIEVSLDSYKNLKKVLNALDKRADKLSYYNRNRIKYFLQLSKLGKSSAVREQFVKEFSKYIGIKKNGKVGSRKKVDIRSTPDGLTASIRVNVRKKRSRRVFRDYFDFNEITEQDWKEIRAILLEYNAFDYFDFFYTDMYPGWVDRVKKRLGNENIPSHYFLELIYEWMKKYG